MNVIDCDSMIVQIQSQYELAFLIESVLRNSDRRNMAAATAILRQLCKLQKSNPPSAEWLALLDELD